MYIMDASTAIFSVIVTVQTSSATPDLMLIQQTSVFIVIYLIFVLATKCYFYWHLVVISIDIYFVV